MCALHTARQGCAQGLTLNAERSTVRPRSGWAAANDPRAAGSTAHQHAGAVPSRDLVQYLASAGQLPRVIAGTQPKRVA